MKATATGHWKTVLRNKTAEELFALEEEVRALMQNPAWAEMVGLIKQGKSAILTSLTSSQSTPDYGDQCRALGHIAGLEEAPNIAQAILEAAQQRRADLERAAAIQAQEAEEGLPR